MRNTGVDFVLNREIKQELDSMPTLNLKFVQTKIERELAKEKDFTKNLSQSQIGEELRGILNPEKEITWFFNTDILKANKHCSEELVQLVVKLFKNDKMRLLFKELFWLVHYIKFQPKKEKEINEQRQKISIYHSQSLRIPGYKDEDVSHLSHLIFAYLCHSSHFRLFKRNRNRFPIRFILDCYHIIFFEMSGVLVSDFYVHSQIKLVFEDRFFFYKQEGILSLTKINPEQGLQFYKHFQKTKQQLTLLRMTSHFTDEDRDLVKLLFTTIHKKFSYFQMQNTSKSSLYVNKMTTELAKALIDLSKEENCEQIVREKRNKMKLDKVMNIGRPKIVKIEDDVKALEQKDFLLKAKSYIHQKKPKKNRKFQFDCSQLSPPLRNIIGSVILPTKKKKISISSFQVSDFSANDLNKLYNFNSEKRPKKKAKRRLFFKKSNNHHNMIKQNEAAKKFMMDDGVDPNSKTKFLEFFALKEVLDKHHSPRFPANEKLNEVRKRTNPKEVIYRQIDEWLKKMKGIAEIEQEKKDIIDAKKQNDIMDRIKRKRFEKERAKLELLENQLSLSKLGITMFKKKNRTFDDKPKKTKSISKLRRISRRSIGKRLPMLHHSTSIIKMNMSSVKSPGPKQRLLSISSVSMLSPTKIKPLSQKNRSKRIQKFIFDKDQKQNNSFTPKEEFYSDKYKDVLNKRKIDLEITDIEGQISEIKDRMKSMKNGYLKL